MENFDERSTDDDVDEMIEEVLSEDPKNQNDIPDQPSGNVQYVITYNIKNEVTDLLRQWGLLELCELFDERKIDLDCLEQITVSDIDQLIPLESISARIKFKARLAEWRSLKNLPSSSISESLGVCSSSSVLLSDHRTDRLPKTNMVSRSEFGNCLNNELQNLNVEQILKSNSRGKGLLLKKAPFNSSERKDLIALITDFALFNQILLGTKEISSIADQVKRLFPFEAKTSYYVTSGQGGRARGQLYTHYNNKVKSLRRKGVLPCRSKYRNSDSDTSTSSPSSPLYTPPSDNNQYLNEKEWLKYNSQPLELTIAKWKNCFGIRRADILNKTTAEILNEWPLLTQSFGLYLIDLDFIYLYNEDTSNALKKKWADFQLIFLETLSEQVGSASKPVKELLTQINATGNQDLKDLLTFKLLHYKLPPCKKISLENGKKWHVSIQDAINSSVIEGENQADVMLKFRKIKETYLLLHLNLQPMLVASENQFYIVFDNIYHKAESFLSALDSAVKIIYVFNLKYPLQSQNVWWFIESFFFNLNSGILSSATTALINELKVVASN